MSRLALALIAPLCGCVRLLQTRRETVGAARRLLLTLLMLPPFSAIVALLRAAAMVRGTIETPPRLVDGSRFVCRLPDLVQLYMHVFGIWEPDLTQFIKQRLKPGDVFIDVGANVGYYTALAARCVGPTGAVVAIEASPAVFEALKRNLAMNEHCANVRAVQMAAAAERGTISVYAGPAHNRGLTTTVQSRGLPVEASVPAAPLGEIVTAEEARRARLVKIDVEGGEPAVLAGMGSLLDLCPEDVEILLELSPAWWSNNRSLPRDVLQPFFNRGFHAYQIDNDYLPWRYLWPNCVKPPRRIDDAQLLNRRVKRLDLVLSRRDALTL